MRSNGERLSDKTPVHGQQPETFLLSLREQLLVERVLVVERDPEPPRGMERRHRQKCQVPVFQRVDHIFRRKTALARPGRMEGIVLEPHFQDRHGAHEELRPKRRQDPSLGIQEFPRPVHDVEQVGRIE